MNKFSQKSLYALFLNKKFVLFLIFNKNLTQHCKFLFLDDICENQASFQILYTKFKKFKKFNAKSRDQL